MQIEFWTSEERVYHILNAVKGSFIEKWDGKFVLVSLKINDGIEALQLFHAGVDAGFEIMENTVKNHYHEK